MPGLHRSSHRLCRLLPGLQAYRQLQADQQQQAGQPQLQQQQRALLSDSLQHTLAHSQRNQLPGLPVEPVTLIWALGAVAVGRDLASRISCKVFSCDLAAGLL
ncbi:TPA: hypothetical protein ACH3X3_003673 [Trebouxia sp. C0006]